MSSHAHDRAQRQVTSPPSLSRRVCLLPLARWPPQEFAIWGQNQFLGIMNFLSGRITIHGGAQETLCLLSHSVCRSESGTARWALLRLWVSHEAARSRGPGLWTSQGPTGGGFAFGLLSGCWAEGLPRAGPRGPARAAGLLRVQPGRAGKGVRGTRGTVFDNLSRR